MKLRAPESFADDNHLRLARLVLIGCEDTPCDWWHAEGREIIRRGDFAVNALWEFPSLEIEAGVMRSAKFRKRRALPFEIREVADGNTWENIPPRLLHEHDMRWVFHA